MPETLDGILRLTKACEVKSCACDELAGKIGLYDWKSGGGIYVSYGAQVAAYASGENVKKFLGKTHGIEYTAILRIGTNHKRTGGYELDVYDMAQTKVHWKEFLAALQICNANYKPFRLEKEILEIPDVLDITVEREEIPRRKPRARKPKRSKRNQQLKSMKVQKDSGKFLNAEDVNDQELAKIVTEGEEVESQFGTRLQIGLKIVSGEDKVLTLNPTSKNALIEAYGDDTKDWTGKEARIHIVKTMVSGKAKQVIYLTRPNRDLEGNLTNE